MVERLAKPIIGSLVRAELPTEPQSGRCTITGIVRHRKDGKICVRVIDVVIDGESRPIRQVSRGEDIMISPKSLIRVVHPRRREVPGGKTPKLIVTTFRGALSDIILVSESEPIEIRVVEIDDARNGRSRFTRDRMITERGVEEISPPSS